MSEQDTREKLEAELRDELRLVFGGNGGQRYASYKFVQSLLDRQDAITQKEFAKAQEESTLEVMRANAKLRKEVDELRAELETYRKYAEQGECEKPQSEENGDTREQLEADIEKLCTGILAHRVEYQKEYCKLHGLQPDKNHSCWSETQWLYPVIMHLLNRQAAITKHKFWECYANGNQWEAYQYETRCAELIAERDELKTRVVELTAERDELQAAIDAMNNGQFYSMYKAKCEECEQLKKVVRTQAESFKKLECELAGKQ